MKNLPVQISQWSLLTFLLFLLLLSNCSIDDVDTSHSVESHILADGIGFSSSSSGSTGSDTSGLDGLITAGEWNDLDNWDFWNDLLLKEDFDDKADYWGFHTKKRVSVIVRNGLNSVADANIELLRSAEPIWITKTDNLGRAELWVDLFDDTNDSFNPNEYTLTVNGTIAFQNVMFYENGVIEISFNHTGYISNKVELAFLVDATGSMSDELEFLKDDLESVIREVEDNNSTLDISTACVFYRDEGDDYVVTHSDFTNDLHATINFIDQQQADGGGDYPEAVHSALQKGIDELKWSKQAKTRIAFLLLDAPPHYESQVIDDIQKSTQSAAEQGIKIIPITASGVDKDTEFLMRFCSLATNGTYVFITNHSGIGNDHIEASVGEYEVEYLKDLMIRLIAKYSE